MDFELSEDQRELQRVVRDVVERECPPSLVRDVVEKGDEAATLWSTYVGLDWTGLTLPEADGGIGYGAVELVLLLDELGRVADPTPLLATASQYAPLVREAFADRGDVRGALLAEVAAGRTGAAAFAGSATGPGAWPAAPTITAEPGPDGAWLLSGTARHVLDGDRAEQVAVVAATPHGGLGVFVVAAADLTAERRPTFDASLHVADVAFDGSAVPAERAAVGPHVGAAVERATHWALAGIAAHTVGACQRIFELDLRHIEERRQFGVPIGSFQALKHMAVDVYVAIERARALAQFAGLTIDADDDRRTVAAAMAKAAAGDAQRIAAQHGVQFFGGLGFTWENDLQLFIRRAKAGELLLGSSAHHRARVARATLAEVGR